MVRYLSTFWASYFGKELKKDNKGHIWKCKNKGAGLSQHPGYLEVCTMWKNIANKYSALFGFASLATSCASSCHPS